MALTQRIPDHSQKEMERLRSKRKLENAVREKDREIRHLKSKLEDQNLKDKEIKDLKKRITILETENDKLKRKIRALKSQNSDLAKNLEEYKKKTDDKIQTLRKELNEEKISNSDLRKNVDLHMLYIAQIAFQFRENAYYIVMGKNFYENYCPEYSLQKIDSKISEIPDKKRRMKAQNNWKQFKKKVGWSPEMLNVLKQIRKTRNEIAHPGDLDEARAKEAIQELHKQRKLKGIISKEKVQNIVHMWSISNTLVL